MFAKRLRFCGIVVGCIGLLALRGPAGEEDVEPARLLERADRLFEQKNYREAAELYRKLLETSPRHEKWRHASESIITCNLRLELFDDALEAARDNIARSRGTPREARAERLAGNLYMLIPHWGTRAGGEFHRGQWKQGIQLWSYRHDRKEGAAHLERARELYARLDADPEALAGLPADERAGWHDERIECIFDLAAVYGRFGIYENQWHFWYTYWAERDDARADTVGEDDFDEYHSHWQLRRQRPVGLRIGPDGKPLFAAAPKTYRKDLSDDERILYLLGEIRELDRTENRRHTGLSYYRQAMLARARFGMDRLNGYAGIYYFNGTFPLKEELEDQNPWELGDREAIVLAGGRIRRVELPTQWDVLGLLRTVVSDHSRSGIADQAQYAVALYHQSRQQYLTAIEQYGRLEQLFPGSDWNGHARGQIARIRAPQVMISNSGVQLPREPARIQISYRNTERVWFVARRVDHEGFLEEIRQQPIDRDKGLPGFWSLASWHNYFVHGHHQGNFIYRVAAKHIGEEVARWSDEVRDDGTHRYAQATLQTPLEKGGAYLVYAYLGEPPAEDGGKTGGDALSVGASRAILALTDLSIVEKKVREGNLYFICDARSGAPVPGASVRVLEVWSVWNRKRKKSDHFKELHTLTTDDDGMAILKRPGRQTGNLHVLVKAGEERLAWSGMAYWSHYHASRMRDGLLAYVITDRPVYRPEQTVRYKVWLRQMKRGILENLPSRSVTVTIYDPRGNKVQTRSTRADDFGGIEGELVLGEEPPLGVYRIYVHGQSYAGGQNFRVEEYKKPEYEVTVEPGTTHARLGDTVTAVIRGEYYFGGPVTDATVKYRILREEYTHRYYFPGRWDWLYGPGYGWVWYDSPWFPWWGKVSRCWAPPTWWWGYRGVPAPTPVRELVQQGEGRFDAAGRLKLEIPTAAALRDHPDRDHRYIVQAEVRDASRRVITGEGAVKVTRQAYFAFVQPDGGYYRPGEEMVIRVRCLSPDNEPIETEGVVSISSVVFGGPDNAHIEERELRRWKASTDSRGELEFRLRHEKSGQLKIKFEAPDKWAGVVEGHGLVWVCGRDFDGRLHRFNDLELITDKRTYRPGEVAHVMINTRKAGSHVLFSDDLDSNHLISWRLLHLPKKHTIVDIPITRESQPNFFVEATTVADTRVHQQSKRICVPPENGMLDVSVEADRPEYRPGDRATVRVTARTPDGKPARAQVALCAFDRSVLYIQPEYTPLMAKFFHGNVRHHSMQMTTNLLEQFSAWGHVLRPFESLHPTPANWWGLWGPSVRDWRTITSGVIRDLAEGASFEDESGEEFRQASSSLRSQDALAQSPAAAGLGKGRAAGLRADKKKEARAPGEGGGAGGAGDFAAAEVRKAFADTAVWLTSLTTDADGRASASFDMPENLTTWKINAWGMTGESRVGQVDASVITTKNLLVRLQAPRFFMEYDEVVISANVHNYLDEAKTARVGLEVPASLLALLKETPATVDVPVPAGGEVRVDWRVKVVGEGTAAVTVRALTDVESDAMEMRFPVLVHGITKQVATTGSMRPDETEKTVTVNLQVPGKRRPESTRLEVQFAPSLVGAMLDALPYLIHYPYGCTEQTMSRFLPAVLTLKTLQNMGIRLDDVREVRGRLAEIRRIEKGEGLSIYADSPIFDQGELEKMIAKGLSRITNMQHDDGGWGWWTNDRSSGYLTSYVLWALCTAQQCDVQVNENMIQRGMQFLKRWEEGEMRKLYWTPHAQHAFVAHVLSLKNLKASYKPPEGDDRPGDLIERLHADRDELGLYGKALLGLALAELEDLDRARNVLRNILQYREENEKTQVTWFRTPRVGWWYWWNSDIETNATILRLITRLEPKSTLAPKLVKYLLNNRRNGYYWRSTRDTTLCIAALSEFAISSGETAPDYTLTLDFDNGATVKTVKIDRESFFTYDNRFVLEGVTLGGGMHTLKITKQGPGALYFNTYLRYFTKEESITAAGHELEVERSYTKLVQIPWEVEVEGSEGQKIVEKRLRYERVPVRNGDTVQSGDVILVELRVKSDNDYTYLCFEDMKPAGCEPTQVRSGGKGQEGFYSYMELRDEKVVFFVNALGQGEHLLRYRLRAEIPGVFHALPTVLYGMYVPELRANSNERLIRITDD